MKAAQREFLADLRAAAVLARPEAVDAALQGLRRLPDVAGNQPLPARLVDQVLLPAGEILGRADLPVDSLAVLARDPLAAVRALAGAAMLPRRLNGDNAVEGTLQNLAGERREDVRRALAGAGVVYARAFSDQLQSLAQSWLLAAARPQTSPETRDRLQSTALRLLCPLADSRAPALLEIIRSLPAGLAPEANAALADLLAALAEAGSSADVLNLLESWASISPPNAWLIGRVLAGGWALDNRARAEAILARLESRTGPTRYISNARRALSRRVEG